MTCLALAWVGAAAAGAQRLPLRCWGVRDGLAAAGVHAILQDARGYLWVGTGEGLSRFDGYTFHNFGVADGLGHPHVNDLLEDDAGRLWVATNGGGVTVVDTRPTGVPSQPLRSFTIGEDLAANRVNAVLSRGRQLWLTTDRGVYRAESDEQGVRAIRRVLGRPDPATSYWLAALRDTRERLWFGVDGELLEVSGERLRRHPLPAPIAASSVVDLAERPDRSLLVTANEGIYEHRPGGVGEAAWRRLPLTQGPLQTFFDLEQGPAGELWIASRQGLIRWYAGAQETFTQQHGLPDTHVRALARDRHGNLWIGTNAAGLCRLAPETIVSYAAAEGLPDLDVVRVVESREGRLIAVTLSGGAVEVRGDHVVPLHGSSNPPFDTIGSRLLQDREGVWWAGAGPWWTHGEEAIFRMPAAPVPDFRRAERVSGSLGLPDAGLYLDPQALLEDEPGNLWFSVRGRQSVYRRAPGSRDFEPVPIGPSARLKLAEADGSFWFDTYEDFRLRRGGRTWVLPAPRVGLASTARAVLRDRGGRLWIGFRYLGLGRLVEQSGRPPRIRRLTTADGLLSDAISALAEDRDGRLWIGTGRGVQILDPESGHLERLTMADGLAGDSVNHLLADSRGRMWVATATGLSRVEPFTAPEAPPPPVYLTRVRAAGRELRISPVGATRLAPLTLSARRSDLLVEFVGLSFARERELKYQYRLGGAMAAWSPPSEERTLNLARLAAGRYRLEVRAVDQQGMASEVPAVVPLKVVPPVWRRGWFLAALAGLVCVVLIWAHRLRVARLLALERVRSQIAADLHDDVGAGLSEIAILSEVACDQEEAAANATLRQVAGEARELREALADTVWAVDPHRDRGAALLQRMREITYRLLETDGVEVDFAVPDERKIEGLSLSPDRRRDLYLLFKELVHNVARHAGASRVDVRLEVDGGGLRLLVRDDGCGFDPANARDGHGLSSVQARAERLRAGFELVSAPGHGCTVHLSVPLHV